MLAVYINVFLYILAISGAIFIILSVTGLIRVTGQYDKMPVTFILVEKNCESMIEGIIRHIFEGDFFRKLFPAGRLLVVDLDSTDQTLAILEKLQKQYGNLEIIKDSDKESIFNQYIGKHG